MFVSHSWIFLHGFVLVDAFKILPHDSRVNSRSTNKAGQKNWVTIKRFPQWCYTAHVLKSPRIQYCRQVKKNLYERSPRFGLGLDQTRSYLDSKAFWDLRTSSLYCWQTCQLLTRTILVIPKPIVVLRAYFNSWWERRLAHGRYLARGADTRHQRMHEQVQLYVYQSRSAMKTCNGPFYRCRAISTILRTFHVNIKLPQKSICHLDFKKYAVACKLLQTWDPANLTKKCIRLGNARHLANIYLPKKT